jgi:hypothetical protein
MNRLQLSRRVERIVVQIEVRRTNTRDLVKGANDGLASFHVTQSLEFFLRRGADGRKRQGGRSAQREHGSLGSTNAKTQDDKTRADRIVARTDGWKARI